MSELEQILADIESNVAASAAKRDWNPDYRGEIDIRIKSDGSWYHDGRKFKRDSLVRLFAGILRREQGQFFLVTPAEKLRIEVDDAPFVATLVEQIDENGDTAIVFKTNIGEPVVLDPDHPIRIEIDPDNGAPRPYILMRDGIEALISRSAFYDLLNFAHERDRDGTRYLYVTSLGYEFELGSSHD